jgi:hypothetical protein
MRRIFDARERGIDLRGFWRYDSGVNVVAPRCLILRKLPCWGTLVVAACLVTACDSGRETDPPAPKPFVYVEPPKPVATHVPAGMSAMIDQLAELREKIAELEMELTEVSTVHRETSFDDLLNLDPDTLGNDQLSYLWHFADKGYFTVERLIMIQILEDRLNHDDVSLAGAANIAERAKALSKRYEAQIRELQLAVDLYAERNTQQFNIPENLTAEQTDLLRGMVKEKLSVAKQECAVMDAKIDHLQKRCAARTRP